MGLIYKITSPSNRVYVGQTTKTAKQRIIQYKSKRKKIGKSLVLRSIEKYGWDSHIFEVIEDNVSNDKLNQREVYWISKLNTFVLDHLDGMNLTRGGDYRESWRNDKTRVERAKLRRGEKSPGWGKKLSEETKRKISESISKFNKLNGIKPSEKCNELAREKHLVKVIVYDINGFFVNEYESIISATKALNLNRRCAIDVVNNKQKHTKGYILKRKTDGYPLKIDTSNTNFFFRKKNRPCIVGRAA